MNGFVANPAPAPDADVDTVAGDGWWPDLSVSQFKQSVRFDTNVETARIRDALIFGMISADVELTAWRGARVAEGVTALEQVDAPRFGGVSRPVLLWRQAVYAYAAARLIETHNDVTATREGRDRNAGLAVGADDHRRAATVAIRDLIGVTRSRVSLK